MLFVDGLNHLEQFFLNDWFMGIVGDIPFGFIGQMNRNTCIQTGSTLALGKMTDISNVSEQIL